MIEKNKNKIGSYALTNPNKSAIVIKYFFKQTLGRKASVHQTKPDVVIYLEKFSQGDATQYGARIQDAMDRLNITQLVTSFDELCELVRTALTKWHAPRRKPQAHLRIAIRDGGIIEHWGTKTVEPPQGFATFPLSNGEKHEIRIHALTATADAMA